MNSKDELISRSNLLDQGLLAIVGITNTMSKRDRIDVLGAIVAHWLVLMALIMTVTTDVDVSEETIEVYLLGYLEDIKNKIFEFKEMRKKMEATSPESRKWLNEQLEKLQAKKTAGLFDSLFTQPFQN